MSKITRGLSVFFAIASLLSAGVASAQTAEPFCHDFKTQLKIGSTGPGVTALQTALQLDGEFSTTVRVTDHFGPRTLVAVRAFQEKYASEILTPSGLTRGTGVVGGVTRAKLNALYGCSTTARDTTDTTPRITVTSPNGGESLIAPATGVVTRIAWSSANLGLSRIDVDLLSSSGAVVKSIAHDIVNDGSVSWPVDASLMSGSYKIRVTATGAGFTAVDTSDAVFTVVNSQHGQQDGTPTITVKTPTKGSGYDAGAPGFVVTWSENGFVPKDLRITLNGTPLVGGSVITLGSLGASTQLSYSVTTPNVPTGTDYVVSVCDEGTPSPIASFKPLCGNSAQFTITGAAAAGVSGTLDYDNNHKLDAADSQLLLKVAVGTVACPTGKTCDLNGDGKVSAADALKLLQLVGDTTTLGRYDYDNNHKVDAVDAKILLQYAVSMTACPAGKTCDINGNGQLTATDADLLVQQAGSDGSVLGASIRDCAPGDLYSALTGQKCA